MTTEVFTVSRDELRRELAADLGRGGYVYRDGSAGGGSDRYFEKSLVLSRPGLLARSAKLLTDLIGAECERIAVTAVGPTTLGTALAQETGVPLLLGEADADGAITFDGEHHSDIKAVLLEDVVFTGERAVSGAQALAAEGADVLGVLCLLDRECGGAQRLADAGFGLRALYMESELLAHSHAERA